MRSLTKYDPIELDRIALRVAIAATLYYGADESSMEDSEYDSLSAQIAENWDGLTPLRQWMFGSAREIAATGFHILATSLVLGSAACYLRRNTTKRLVSSVPEQFSKTHKVHYYPISKLSTMERIKPKDDSDLV